MSKRLEVFLASAVLLTAPLAAQPPAAPSAPQPLSEASTAHPELWPQIAAPIVLTPAQEARVQALIARMDLPCKVGQILQGDILKVTGDDVARYHLGSVLNGGSSGPHGDDLAPAPVWLALADDYYAGSMKAEAGCPAIPVMWGIDSVHGHNNIIGATLFPQNVGLGAMRDPDLIERIGAATAEEIRVTGQEWTFAPTIAVPQDYRWGRAYEGYSSDPALVASYAGRMIRGLQGEPSTKPILSGPHVAATAKHFLGDGGTFNGKDQGDTRIDETTLRFVHGEPYAAAIEAGVASVMVSYSSWNGTKMTGNKSLLNDVLKERMGFAGLLVTDWNGHGQVPGCTITNCPQALKAGVDMFMIPDAWKSLYDNLQAQVKDGTVPMARLDDAVARVLRMKMRLGLFEAGKPSSRPLAGQWDLLGAPTHRAVAREAVRKSLVLLKNDGVLPLKPSAHILVAGDAADDIARQSGGWSISWQGTGLTNANFPGATSIWKGIEQAVSAAGGQAELAPLGDFKTKPDAAIVVFGETPYAEILGDIPSLQLRAELHGPLATMRRLRARGIPVVAVMLSGRPLFVNAELNAANGFVEAWLPGSEGGGIADMLFARDGADFQGRLPMVWPANPKPGAPALFGFGFGLKLAHGAQPWTALSEDPGVEELGKAGLLFDKGEALPGWTLQFSLAGAKPVPVGKLPASLLGGRVRVRAESDEIQPGAKRISIKPGTGAVAIELAASTPADLRREALAPIMAIMTVKLAAAPAAPWTATVRCGESCGKSIPLPSLAGLPIGAWRKVGIPLRCFGMSQPDMGKVTAPFSIATEGAADLSLAQVTLGTVADVAVPCPPA